MYVSIVDVRAEGVSESIASDERVTYAITLSQKYIEMITGRFFELREKTVKLNGDDSRIICLPVFLLNPGQVIVDGKELIYNENYFLYNRFLPDDRFHPRIFLSEKAKKGSQNIEITGQFGFVEEDGSTPVDIKKICIKLVIKELPSLYEKKEDHIKKRIISEKTDDHSYTLSELINSGGLTGDNEIDSILTYYSRKTLGIFKI